MFIYFLILRLAALLGHPKAKRLVSGQAQALEAMRDWRQSITASAHVVWIHVASVGEFEQVRPIIERLRREGDQRKILLTFFSPSGYEMRKNYNQVDLVLYLPFANRRNARRWIAALQPEMAIFVKYEFWPAYLKELQKNAIPTYLISAIFRPKQLFFRPWGKWYRKLLFCFSHIFVQDQTSAQLLADYSISAVTIAGDTRFDRVLEVKQTRSPLPALEAFASEGVSKILVAGSTWPEEEKMLARYVSQRDDVRLVLVPHELHEQHLRQIYHLFEGRYQRYTQARITDLHLASVLLVDTMGLLSSIYHYAHVAYIGGGFGVGIHNTLEAAVYGKPIIFGPNWKKFREAHGLQDAGAAIAVKNYKQLAAALDHAFQLQTQMGQAAAQYVADECGATQIIYQALFGSNMADHS